MSAALLMHRFRYRHPDTGRWVQARYRATLADIRARYAEWILEDDAEHRRVEAAAIGALAQPPAHRGCPGGARVSHPGRDATGSTAGHRSHGAEVVDHARTLDALEAALLACFLRRYVTYCARRGRYAAMNGAAQLLREVARRAP